MKFWTKALGFTLGLFVLYGVLLSWLFDTSTYVNYLTNFANGYVFWSYYINLFLLTFGIITYMIRLVKKQGNKYFFGWLVVVLGIILIQWLFFYFLGAQR